MHCGAMNDGQDDGMDDTTITTRLAFLRAAEALKDVLRSGHTSGGRRESTAEHSWRLCLMALVFADGLAGLDMLRVIKLCIVHDLAEAIHGDVPATEQVSSAAKTAQEREDLHVLAAPLDAPLRDEILALWEEYAHGATPEARAVKAMDKLETILQHAQGANPPDFDYAFNLEYGRQYTSGHPLFAAIRAAVDDATRARMACPAEPAADTLIIRETSPREFDAISDVWEASVRATHHFLGADDIAALRRLVRDEYLALVDLRVAVDARGAIRGFAGVADGKVEMLFIAPAQRGQGVGAALLRLAVGRMGADRVDVNEQNPAAVGFYEHMGFEVVGRTSVDGQGRPFPILQMRLRAGGLRRR